jgi:UDP-sugar pyrophosphorylase
VTKPHGHGDIHALLHSHGVAQQWHDAGLRYLVLFQDTNGLAFHTLPLMVGVSESYNLIMNSLAVPRKAKQAIGAITRLKHELSGAYR